MNGGDLHTVRHLQRSRDWVDLHHAEDIDVDDMAKQAGYSKAHFTRLFTYYYGESPRAYLLTRRLERAARLLRTTDWPVNEICWAVGLKSVGSFTTSFTRMFEQSPSQWRAAAPSASLRARIPSCVQAAHGRPKHRTFREAAPSDVGQTDAGHHDDIEHEE